MMMIRDMNNTEKLYTSTIYTKKSYTVRLIGILSVGVFFFVSFMDQSQQIQREENKTCYNYLEEYEEGMIKWPDHLLD